MALARTRRQRIYSELEAAGLVEQKKQYLARPTLIYVNEISGREDGSFDVVNGGIQLTENTASRAGKSEIQAVGKAASIKTYHNQNENSQIENIKTYPNQTGVNDVTGISDSTNLKEHLDEVLELDTLKARYPLSAGSLEEIRDIIAEVIALRRRVTFEGKVVPAETAAERFRKLTAENICMVLDALSQTESDIRRIDAYISTALYGSTFTVMSRNEVGWKSLG